MKIKYMPFSESISLGTPVKNLEFAESVIKPYFMMSLRYHECYYEKQQEGDTIYFMNFPECSLLFFFSSGARSHRINGFCIQAKDRQKAWLSMLSLIQSLRSYPFKKDKDSEAAPFSREFLENTADCEDAMLDALVPFHFIISSLPDICFPACREMRLFNRFHMEDVQKSFFYVTRYQINRTTISVKAYDKLSEIFWMPPSKTSKKWHLEYHTGKVATEGRHKGYYIIIQKEIDLPGKNGICRYGELAVAVERMLQEN